jgi:hypothetical protein
MLTRALSLNGTSRNYIIRRRPSVLHDAAPSTNTNPATVISLLGD